MSRIKVAVIGVGYLGEFHAQKYKVNRNVDLIGVVDTNITRCKESHFSNQSLCSVAVRFKNRHGDLSQKSWTMMIPVYAVLPPPSHTQAHAAHRPRPVSLLFVFFRHKPTHFHNS